MSDRPRLQQRHSANFDWLYGTDESSRLEFEAEQAAEALADTPPVLHVRWSEPPDDAYDENDPGDRLETEGGTLSVYGEGHR